MTENEFYVIYARAEITKVYVLAEVTCLSGRHVERHIVLVLTDKR